MSKPISKKSTQFLDRNEAIPGSQASLARSRNYEMFQGRTPALLPFARKKVEELVCTQWAADHTAVLPVVEMMAGEPSAIQIAAIDRIYKRRIKNIPRVGPAFKNTID